MSQSTLNRIDGTVVAIRFSRDTFTVADFLAQGSGEITIVGDLANVEEGQKLSLYGRRHHHPRHGEQFRVDYFHTYLEASRGGILRFLIEEVQGVGPRFAERIVSYYYPLYGEETLDRLQDAPESLHDVPGLGEKRARAVIAALREHYGTRHLLMKLYQYGLSPTLARTILKYYEEKGVDPVRVFEETPYQMVHDLPELGFETVDRIARQLGVPADDDGRICGAISHVLSRAFNRDGHLFLPERPLLRQVIEVIWGDRPPEGCVDRIGDALEVLRNQRYVQIVPVRNILAFYSREGWIIEEGLVTHLARLLDASIGPLEYLRRDAEQVRRAAEARAGIVLDDAQRRAFHHAIDRGLCVITGGPGTGKSTLARLVVDSWEEAGLKVKLAAPTGRAARRLSETTGREATTIHRLLDWREGAFQRHEEDPIEADAILIDESSMLDAPLAWALCRSVSSGTRLLFMGDVDQLPSVGPGNVLYDLIESGRLPVARLDRIHRQDTTKENLIVNLAHAVNNAPPKQSVPGGVVVSKRPEEGNLFLFDTRLPWARCACGGVRLPARCPSCEAGSVVAPLAEEARGAELIQELVTDRIPRSFGTASEEIQVIAPRYGGPLGVNELNERLRGALNPAGNNKRELQYGTRQFRLGDRMMAIRNNYEKDVVNGLQGYVIDVDSGARQITVLFDDEIRATFKGEELDDLAHAYAITAHKSQGGEFPVVVLALDLSAGRLLYRQLLYTAVSRARDLLVLVGNPVALDRATANDRPRNRWTGLAWWLERGFDG